MSKKTLYLIRHAKSSWSDPYMRDHDRPLNKRGKRDAPVMAKFLKKNNVLPDLIISSTAVRALEFAEVIAEETGYKKKRIEAIKEMYLADEKEMLEILKNVDDKMDIIFMIGHNPGITYFAKLLSNYDIDNIPTSGIFKLEFETDSWKKAAFGKGRFVSFDYPKKFEN